MARLVWTLLIGWLALAFAFDCQSKDYLRPSNEALRPWVSEPQKIAFMLSLNEIAGGQKAPQKCVSEVLDSWKKEKSRLEKKNASREPWSDLIHMVQDAPVSEPSRRSECEAALMGCGNCHLPRVNNCTYRIHAEEGEKRTVVGRVVRADANSVEITCVECGHEVKRTRVDGARPVDSGKILARDIEKTEWLDGADDLITWWDFRTLNGRGQTARKMLAISAEQGVSCAHCHVSHGDFRLTQNGERFKATGRAR